MSPNTYTVMVLAKEGFAIAKPSFNNNPSPLGRSTSLITYFLKRMVGLVALFALPKKYCFIRTLVWYAIFRIDNFIY